MATELAKAYVQIIPSADGIKDAISRSMGNEADEAGEKAGNSIVSKIKNIIVAAGIGKVLAQTFTEGAALEQSLGGIETLYKESADKMKAYASEAYKTSGVSANTYMENVTSFSASLIKSLGGDTSKAADIANRAMQDMSDNSNKFGTNIQDIQNAYQGFAKQNYTMLDNLKLGYGGTKEEMQRLLKDAQALTGVKYDISNLSDVYTAIGVIQDNLGITGTTAKEAATTFSGSFNSMKAAAQDFLGNLAIGGDVTGTLGNLIDTATTFIFDNAIPMAGNIITGLGTAILQKGPELAQKGYELLTNLVNGFVDNIPIMLPKILQFVQNLGTQLAQKAPELINMGFELLSKLVSGIVSAIPILIQYVPTIISTFANIINNNFPTILAKGAELLWQLITGILSAIPTLVANIPQIISAIWDTLMAVQWLNLGSQIIEILGSGISSMVGFIAGKGQEIVLNIVNKIGELPGQMLSFGKQAVSSLGSGITGLGSWLKSQAGQIISWITDALVSLPGKMLEIGKNLIKGLWNGITSVKDWIIDKIKGFGQSVLDTITGFFGIKSPSRVMADEVGKYLPQGIALGIKTNADSVFDEMNNLSKTTLELAESDFNIPGFNNSDSNQMYGYLQIIIKLLNLILNREEVTVLDLNDREVARALRKMGVVFE